jgi:hypothetical protein
LTNFRDDAPPALTVLIDQTADPERIARTLRRPVYRITKDGSCQRCSAARQTRHPCPPIWPKNFCSFRIAPEVSDRSVEIETREGIASLIRCK